MTGTARKYYTETEDRIAEALWFHVFAQDLEKVTVTQLCQEARVSRDTFYRRFSSPKQAIMDIAVRNADRFIRRCADGCDSFEPFLPRLLSATLRRHREYGPYLLAFCDMDTESRMIHILQRTLTECGYFEPVVQSRQYSAEKKNTIIRCYCTLLAEVMISWARSGYRTELEENRQFLQMMYDRMIQA